MSARNYLGSVRVALLDDHAIVLKGLVAHLEKTSSIAILGSFSSSRHLRALLATQPVDVVLVDYSLALDDIDGVALIRLLRTSYPRLKILVISAHDQGLVVHNLLQAGADGFVAKSQDADDIIHAIDAVMTDRQYLPPRYAENKAIHGKVRLSPREWEVIRCLFEGLTVTEIARKFGRSMKTISAQKSAAYRKLHVSSDNELYKLRDQVLAMGGRAA